MINDLKLLILKLFAKLMKGKIIIYDESKYKDSFIAKIPKLTNNPVSKANEVIYLFWTGDNPLTPNRKKSIEYIRRNSGVKVELITPENLNSYIVEDFPLHHSYNNLSYVHRADYLRAYFMHHHGGGYCDIKLIKHNWKAAFLKLNGDDNNWIIGYPEVAPSAIPFSKGNLGKDLRKAYYRMIGNGAFIAKPKSHITEEWIKQIHFVLDSKSELLKQNPGDPRGKNIGYPLEWSEILGNIFQPLLLKYNDKVLIDESLSINCKNYK